MSRLNATLVLCFALCTSGINAFEVIERWNFTNRGFNIVQSKDRLVIVRLMNNFLSMDSYSINGTLVMSKSCKVSTALSEEIWSYESAFIYFRPVVRSLGNGKIFMKTYPISPDEREVKYVIADPNDCSNIKTIKIAVHDPDKIFSVPYHDSFDLFYQRIPKEQIGKIKVPFLRYNDQGQRLETNFCFVPLNTDYESNQLTYWIDTLIPHDPSTLIISLAEKNEKNGFELKEQRLDSRFRTIGERITLDFFNLRHRFLDRNNNYIIYCYEKYDSDTCDFWDSDLQSIKRQLVIQREPEFLKVGLLIKMVEDWYDDHLAVVYEVPNNNEGRDFYLKDVNSDGSTNMIAKLQSIENSEQLYDSSIIFRSVYRFEDNTLCFALTCGKIEPRSVVEDEKYSIRHFVQVSCFRRGLQN